MQEAFFFTLNLSGDPPPGGVELASYNEAMAQLGRVSPEQIFVGIGRGSNLGPLAPQFRSVSTTLQGFPPQRPIIKLQQQGRRRKNSARLMIHIHQSHPSYG